MLLTYQISVYNDISNSTPEGSKLLRGKYILSYLVVNPNTYLYE